MVAKLNGGAIPAFSDSEKQLIDKWYKGEFDTDKLSAQDDEAGVYPGSEAAE
jgi:hypothetical protein